MGAGVMKNLFQALMYTSEHNLGLLGTSLPPSAALLHRSALQGRNVKSKERLKQQFL